MPDFLEQFSRGIKITVGETHKEALRTDFFLYLNKPRVFHLDSCKSGLLDFYKSDRGFLIQP